MHHTVIARVLNSALTD